MAGSGKSKIANTAVILAVEHPVPVLALGQREEETEKRLGAALICGSPPIVLANAERAVGGELLCQAITEPIVAPRILGSTGNSHGEFREALLQVGGEATRFRRGSSANGSAR